MPQSTKHRSSAQPLSTQQVQLMDAYLRAANYLSVRQIYLYNNSLLPEPLSLADIKPSVVGHWGITPGQNFIYVHLNRARKGKRSAHVLHAGLLFGRLAARRPFNCYR